MGEKGKRIGGNREHATAKIPRRVERYNPPTKFLKEALAREIRRRMKREKKRKKP